MKFKAFGPIIFRMSARSPEETQKFQNVSPAEMLRDPQFVHLLAFSRPEFFKRLSDYSVKKISEPEISATLKKYAIRWGNRHAPASLFAGVGIAEVSSQVKNAIHRTDLVPKEIFLERQIELGRDLILNPSCYWRDTSLSFYSHNALTKKYELDQVQIPLPVKQCLLKLNSKPYNKLLIVKKLKVDLKITLAQASTLVEQLAGMQIIVPAGNPNSWVKVEKPLNSKPGVEAALLWQSPRQGSLQFEEKKIVKILAAAEAMQKIWGSYFAISSQKALLGTISQYIEKFYDHGPVPLLQITEVGLMPLLSKTSPTKLPEQFELFLQKKLLKNREQAEFVWNLEAKDIDQLSSLMNASNSHGIEPKAMSVLAEVSNESDVLSYSFQTSNSATKLFSRMGIFDEEIRAISAKIQNWEKIHFEGQNLSEIKYQHLKPIKNFLAAGESEFEGRIDCQGSYKNKSSFPISEVGLVVVNSKIELVHLPSGKRIRPVGTHLVTYENETHFPYRILRLVERQYSCEPCRWDWGRFEELHSFFPRVEIKGVVVSRARWIIRPKDLVDKFIHDYRVPPRVLLCEQDMALPVEIGSDLFKYEVDRSLRNGKFVVLEEDLFAGDSFEVCIPAFNTGAAPILKKDSAVKLAMIEPKYVINLRIFFDPFRMDDLLTEVRRQFVRKEGAAISFIFYDEGFLHLRLRIFCKNNSEILKIEKRVTAWQENILSASKALAISFQAYGPEQSRWLGAEGLKCYEILSCIDSKFQLQRFTPGVPSIDAVAKYLIFWSQWFAASGCSAESLLMYAYQRIRKLENIQPITLKTPTEEGTAGYFALGDLAAQLRPVKTKVNGFLKRQSDLHRKKWVADFFHFTMNRHGFVGAHGHERLCLQRALKLLNR